MSGEEHLLDEIKRYVGFDHRDEGLLAGLRARVQPRIESIVDDFYESILRHPGAKRSVTGGMEQLRRLHSTLSSWLDSGFSGPWDLSYYERRALIGRRHVQIDLPQQYMFTAIDVVRRHLMDVVIDTSADRETGRAEIHAVNKLLDMELAIMLHTYREDYLLRMQKSERLATYGQLVASIGHELRNPLAVIDSSLYLLRKRLGDNERAVRHVDKIESQVRVSTRIINDLLDIVRDRPAVLRPVDVASLVATAAEAAGMLGGGRLVVDVPADLPRLHADFDQLRQVLLNLLSNAADAAGPEGEIRLLARVDDGHLELTVNDSGPGIAPGIAARLFEPLVTTKKLGIGLGLPLCKRLVEHAGGTLRLGTGPLSGAAFVVRLPLEAKA